MEEDSQQQAHGKKLGHIIRLYLGAKLYGLPLIHRSAHNLIAWMVLLNKLPTKDRLLSWGINIDPICLLCQTANESSKQLFFEYEYSLVVWGKILGLCNLQFTRYYDTVWIMEKCRGKSMLASILRMAQKAFLYHNWREMNQRLHSSTSEAPKVIFDLVCNLVRLRISTIKCLRSSSIALRLCHSQNLS